MKVGDQIRMKPAHDYRLKEGHESVVYTILEITDSSIAVKHPTVGGYFIFSKDMVAEIVDNQEKEKK